MKIKKLIFSKTETDKVDTKAEASIKEDPTVITSTKIYFGGPCPYRYVIRFVPEEDPVQPYIAHRENMKLNNGVWVADVRYWCSPCKFLAEAEKEYQKKLDTEPKH